MQIASRVVSGICLPSYVAPGASTINFSGSSTLGKLLFISPQGLLSFSLIENASSNSKDLSIKCSTGFLFIPRTSEILLGFIFLTLNVTMFNDLASDRDLIFE